MSYAGGKHSFFISDRSGMRFPYSQRAKEWNGSIVHTSEYEPKHAQLEPRHHAADAEALRESRSDRTEPAVTVLLRHNPFTTGTAGESSTTITVQEHSHGREVSSKVRLRDVVGFDGISASTLQAAAGYSIVSVVDENNYTISVSATATTGSIKGGGHVASAGPVTLES